MHYELDFQENNMNDRNSYMLVGTFVTLGLVALIGMLFKLAGGRSSEPNTRYAMFFERDISGLTLGAPVRYLGVEVGQVVDMNLVTSDGTRVRVDLELLQSTPINSATYASLAFQGVTGVAFISLAAEEFGRTSKLVTSEYDLPVIPTKEVGLAALLLEAPEISHKVTNLLDRANMLLAEENIAALARTLANIENISASLARDDTGIAQLANQLRIVLAEAESTFGQIQTVLQRAEPDLLATMSELHTASSNLADISKRIDGWLTNRDRDINKFISGGLGQSAALITDTRSTVRELEMLLSELRVNPSQLIFKPQNDPVIAEH